MSSHLLCAETYIILKDVQSISEGKQKYKSPVQYEKVELSRDVSQSIIQCYDLTASSNFTFPFEGGEVNLQSLFKTRIFITGGYLSTHQNIKDILQASSNTDYKIYRRSTSDSMLKTHWQVFELEIIDSIQNFFFGLQFKIENNSQ